MHWNLNIQPQLLRKRAEGLINHKGMKPDERPLWFDIYKAFPPTVEPKFARPKQDHLSIRSILYQEDAVRAKFHGKGHGIGVTNMLTPGESPTRKLLKEYQNLKAQNVPESELIEQTLKVVGAARIEKQSTTPSSPATDTPSSATKKISPEIKVQDIFSK